MGKGREVRSVVSEPEITAKVMGWKKYPDAKRWRKSPFPLYKGVLYLVKGIIATGAGAFHAGTIQTQAESSPTWPNNRLVGHPTKWCAELSNGGQLQSESRGRTEFCLRPRNCEIFFQASEKATKIALYCWCIPLALQDFFIPQFNGKLQSMERQRLHVARALLHHLLDYGVLSGVRTRVKISPKPILGSVPYPHTRTRESGIPGVFPPVYPRLLAGDPDSFYALSGKD
ncbi:hypothetical protein B0H13DRAFT_1861647 [Mycena leptocephala]|nr:hypothetical protein B0H13DRAFT_1861647 [Mycena leptocephala]